jgi:hypothetical protein
LSKNLNDVAHTATKADTGTAISMVILKKMSIIGILLPAPDRPPAFDKAIKMNIKTIPIDSITTLCLNGIYQFLVIT